MKKLLVAMLVGAGLSYFFDPDGGALRRATWQRRLDRSPAPSPVATSVTGTSATSPTVA